MIFYMKKLSLVIIVMMLLVSCKDSTLISLMDKSLNVEVAVSPKDTTITVGGVSFEMKYVRGGIFQMGSKDDWSGDEKPVHTVKLSGYYICKTEVTQALWMVVTNSNPSEHKGDDLPVENVNWNDCQMFIGKLNQLTGLQFCLPTEAQWEFAARGGNKSRRYKYSGSNDVEKVAWCSGISSGTAHPVGSKQENELGLYDMSGNVWEWCSDWFGHYPSSLQKNPTGSSSGAGRVLRGGSYSSGERSCISTYRYHNDPKSNYVSFGFRLALNI